MRILSLDLGTNTGWAVGVDGVLTDCGTWTLATDKEIKVAGLTRMNRRLDPRIPVLWNHVGRTIVYGPAPLDWIVFEDVQFSSSTQQTQLWSSFRGALWAFAAMNSVQIECLATGKLKLFGANHGGATKEMMAAKLITGADPRIFLDVKSAMPQFEGKILDDNAVDAVHLLYWAMKTLKHA